MIQSRCRRTVFRVLLGEIGIPTRMPAMTRELLSHLVQQLRRTIEADALDTTSDADLLAAFRRHRDPIAFEALVRRHGPRVLAACRKVLADSADVEDAFQATFLVLMRDPGTVRNHRSLASWLFGVAHRVSLKALARRKRRQQIEVQARTRSNDSPDLSWREACATLHEELDRLPDTYRLPLILCYLEGLSRDEAATQLGRTLNSVKKSLERGREQLRKRLVRRGVTLSAGLLAAVADTATADSSLDLTRFAVNAAVRPSANVTALASAIGTGLRMRTISVCLAASILAVGVALGMPGDPKQEPLPKKELPATPVAKKETPADEGKKGERISFAGRVVDPEGKPVKGAKIFLTGYGRPSYGKGFDHRILATSNADGTYRFEMPRGEYVGGEWKRWHRPFLATVASGYGFGVATYSEVGDSAAEMKLVPDQPIRGRLVDLQGKPVAGAVIRIRSVYLPDNDDLRAAKAKWREQGWYRCREGYVEPFLRRAGELDVAFPGIPEVHSGLDGKFAITGIGDSRLALLAIEGPGIAMVNLPVLTEAGDTFKIPLMGNEPAGEQVTIYRAGLQYVAAPSQQIEGIVTDKDTGKPILGLTVRSWTDLPHAWIAYSHAKSVTDQDGRYRLVGMPTGRQMVLADPSAEFPYFSSSKLGGRADHIEPVQLDFALKRAAWVTGQVIDVRSKKPVADVAVEYDPARENTSYQQYLGGASQLLSRSRTDREGRFRIPAAPGPGWLVFDGRPASFISAAERPIQGDATELKPSEVIELPEIIGEKSRSTLRTEWYLAVVRVTANIEKPADYVVKADLGLTVQVRLNDPEGMLVRDSIAVGIRGRNQEWSQPLSAEPSVMAVLPERPYPIIFYNDKRQLGLVYQPKVGDLGPWNIALQPTATVLARLTRSNGEPIVEKKVYVSFRWQGLLFALPGKEFRTDAEGRVKIAGIIGDMDYSLHYRTPVGRIEDILEHTFRAKPGETKDLGTIGATPPKE
jgi:RNA polymerase sigma factor (sigma-70 family)